MNYRIVPFATALLVAQAQLPGAVRAAALESPSADAADSPGALRPAPQVDAAPAPDPAAARPMAAPALDPAASRPMAGPEPTAAPGQIPAQPAGLAGIQALEPTERTIKTFNYRLARSTTRIPFQGNALHADVQGQARVRNRDGANLIDARFEKLPAPSTFGEANLTYVLWSVSPEGRARNLGELQVRHGRSRIRAVEALPAFGLVVTAEPHYAVTRPSDAIVLENAVGPDTPTRIEVAQATVRTLPQSGYSRCLLAAALPAGDPRAPLEVLQARQSVRIAEGAGAGRYAKDVLEKARIYLDQAESRKAGDRDRLMTARAAAATAEEARVAATRARAEELQEQERQVAEARLEQARREAARAEQAKAEAIQEARRAGQEASRASVENQGLRSRLMAELSGILQTKATARGLIVSMSGVLFKTGKAALLPPAREKLAKVAGVLATHKGLRIQAEGFTDSTGTPELNARLSEQRAAAARDFLVSQGVSPQAITVRGFGAEHPIADNATATGRQENRRVELVVSGEGLTSTTASPEEAAPAGPAPEDEEGTEG
jgi:outer membrane protein OmpA-like peptidoglycan-associated protein